MSENEVSEQAVVPQQTVAPEQTDDAQELRRQTRRGSIFELGGYIASYVLRLASSTILRSLLVPATFGIMEVVTGVNVGLVMLSDVGIRQSVIQSRRGEEQVFLDTAWTMHAVRGVALWLLSVVLAFPAAKMANEPLLVYVLPIASLTTLLQGFVSTAEFTLRRRMTLGSITALEFGCQLITLATTVTWAVISPTVWALVAGGLVSGVFRLIVADRMAVALGYRNRFRWDAEVRREIFDFGKWITASSAVYFAGMWADRLMLVAFMGTVTAGIYATAILISEAVVAASERVLHGVFYPLFARVSREGIDRLRAVYYATRLRFDAVTMAATGGLMVMAPWVIHLLFDERYESAGWMLQVLSLRAATNCVITPCETCLTSLGYSRYGFFQNLVRAIWVLVGVPVGYALWGVEGVVWVAALSGVPSMLLLLRMFHTVGMLRIDRELLAWVFLAVGSGVGWLALRVLPDAVAVRHFLRVLVTGG